MPGRGLPVQSEGRRSVDALVLMPVPRSVRLVGRARWPPRTCPALCSLLLDWIVEQRGYLGMVRTQSLFADMESSLIERLCPRIFPLFSIEHSESLEGCGHLGMITAQCLLSEGDRPLEKPLRLRVLSLSPEEKS